MRITRWLAGQVILPSLKRQALSAACNTQPTQNGGQALDWVTAGLAGLPCASITSIASITNSRSCRVPTCAACAAS